MYLSQKSHCALLAVILLAPLGSAISPGFQQDDRITFDDYIALIRQQVHLPVSRGFLDFPRYMVLVWTVLPRGFYVDAINNRKPTRDPEAG
ncbi:hypothetical protein BJV78DRAFT_1169530 [Lactifluus subvellereus]|nr:hypothetical protein BJV78DRAFT_1169530 [Lactifluus subvellereus]